MDMINGSYFISDNSLKGLLLCFVLNTFIHLPKNSLKLIAGSQLVRNYNLNTYK